MLAIVGSGLSGAEVASEAGKRGIDYILFDAGPQLGLDHVGASAATRQLSEPAQDPSFEAFIADGGPPYGPASGYRMRVGGRGLYWRGICIRIEPEALGSWPAGARQALADGLYQATEDELARWSGRDSLSAPRTGEEEQLVADVTAAGYAATATPRAVRLRPDGGWSAYSAIPGVPVDRIRSGFPVSEILPGPRGGFALRGLNPSDLLEADTVVLAAGLFENVRLVAGLLATAAGQRMPNRVRIVDHLATGFVLFRPGLRHDPRDASVFAGHHAVAASNLFVESQPVADGTLIDAWAMGEQALAAASMLEVGPPRRVVLDDPARTFLHALEGDQRRLLGELAHGLGIGAPCDDGLGFDAAVERARSEPGSPFIYVAGIGELDHESSGLPLGGDLVDGAGRLRAVPGVHVVGPCLFPRAGAANPTLTSLALARYVTGVVARELS